MKPLHTLAFQATPDSQPALGGAPDPGPDPGTELEPGEGFSVDPEDWEDTQAELRELRDWAAQQQAAQQGGQEQPLDPLADDFQAQLDRYVESKLQPYQGFQEQMLQGEADERALDIIKSITDEGGEFLMPERSTQMARQLAEEFLPQASERYGFGPKAAEAALEAAVSAVREYEEEVGKAYYERQQNQLGSLYRAPQPTPGSGAPAVQAIGTHTARDERDLASQFFNGQSR